MIKSILMMLSALIFFIAGSSTNPEEKIIINQNFPSVIKPGDEFKVTLNVHKSSINGFARLQQNLPEGFTATEIESKGADFIFEDHTVKFIWVNIPSETDFTVSYKVKTDLNITGTLMINGVFVFMENDKAQRHNLASVEIKVDNSINTSVLPKISRKLLMVAAEKGEYKVELNIHPNNVNESAQFTDRIPENFSAELIDAHGANFKFEKSSVVFSWTKLPPDSVFSISYFVKSGKAGPSPVIDGVFLYGDLAEKNTMKEVPLTDESTTINTDLTPADTQTPDQNSTTADTKTIIADKTFLTPEKGITYKVQVSATQKSPVRNGDWFSSKYKITSDVELTYHEGWKKYIIGSFAEYKEASNYKNQTREKIPDAFVVAYENGVRISVKEALRNKQTNQ